MAKKISKLDIYVPPYEMSVFEKAKQLHGGSRSAMIVDAVKEYIYNRTHLGAPEFGYTIEYAVGEEGVWTPAFNSDSLTEAQKVYNILESEDKVIRLIEVASRRRIIKEN